MAEVWLKLLGGVCRGGPLNFAIDLDRDASEFSAGGGIGRLKSLGSGYWGEGLGRVSRRWGRG